MARRLASIGSFSGAHTMARKGPSSAASPALDGLEAPAVVMGDGHTGTSLRGVERLSIFVKSSAARLAPSGRAVCISPSSLFVVFGLGVVVYK